MRGGRAGCFDFFGDDVDSTGSDGGRVASGALDAGAVDRDSGGDGVETERGGKSVWAARETIVGGRGPSEV